MTVREKITLSIISANTGSILLNEEMSNEIMPICIKTLNERCKEIGYDGITYERTSSEYPEIFYRLCFLQVREIINKYLEEKHPFAWFRPMYFSIEEQRKIGMPV